MATPSQPPQPVYHHELNMVIDRLFTKMTSYMDGQSEKLMAQIRLYNQESVNRDSELASAIKVITQQIANLTQQVKDGFTAQAERHNTIVLLSKH